MRGHSQMIPFGLRKNILSIVSHDKLKWFLEDIDHPEWGVDVRENDFKNKFICADVIAWDELIEYGSMSKAKEAGKVKQVGKDYIMQDGEVVEFKIGG